MASKKVYIGFIIFFFCFSCVSLVSLSSHSPMQLHPRQTSILPVTMGHQLNSLSRDWLDGWMVSKASKDVVNHDYEINTIQHESPTPILYGKRSLFALEKSNRKTEENFLTFCRSLSLSFCTVCSRLLSLITFCQSCKVMKRKKRIKVYMCICRELGASPWLSFTEWVLLYTEKYWYCKFFSFMAFHCLNLVDVLLTLCHERNTALYSTVNL